MIPARIRTRPLMTFEQFCERQRQFHPPLLSEFVSCLPGARTYDDYGRPSRRRSVDWMRLAFFVRIRVPNREGWFAGPHSTGASWCWPWQFYRRYYEVRVSEPRCCQVCQSDETIVNATRAGYVCARCTGRLATIHRLKGRVSAADAMQLRAEVKQS